MSVYIGPIDQRGAHFIHGYGIRDGRFGWRGWLTFAGRLTFHIEAHMRRRCSLLGFSLSDDREGALQLHLTVWPFSVWFSVGPFRFLRRFDGRHFIGASVGIAEPYEGIHLEFMYDPFGFHRSNHRYLLVHPIDLIFGRPRTKEVDRSETRIGVPLPEGVYQGSIVRTTYRRRRARWPLATHFVGTHFDPDRPIGVPDDPDCDFYTGEDHIHSMGVKSGSDADVIGSVVTRVMARRIRHGGSAAWLPREKASGVA